MRDFSWVPETGHTSAQDVAGINAWLFPAGSFTVPERPHLVVVGAHRGAGTSTWAGLLGAPEAEGLPADGHMVGVCRSTVPGITAAKELIRQAGKQPFLAFLIVADAPVSLPRAVRREIKILAGAVPVVMVPWVSSLRGATDPDPTTVPAKVLGRIKASLTGHGVPVPGMDRATTTTRRSNT
jgi:hypothetical protein